MERTLIPLFVRTKHPIRSGFGSRNSSDSRFHARWRKPRDQSPKTEIPFPGATSSSPRSCPRCPACYISERTMCHIPVTVPFGVFMHQPTRPSSVPRSCVYLRKYTPHSQKRQQLPPWTFPNTSKSTLSNLRMVCMKRMKEGKEGPTEI